ncbi:hypothetical protein [Candidatus Nitrosoglobus terrae]|uniref:hypothetical protein n=1 Tax=Candidatus Nitrosoglobus terrae TaxID=1630141 RepID=UPI00155256A7|nr:hypothetical protein [Candidatus Nitrosoglobus terrae]
MRNKQVLRLRSQVFSHIFSSRTKLRSTTRMQVRPQQIDLWCSRSYTVERVRL